MKIKIEELKNIVREVVTEAASEGKMQKYYRKTFAKMIATASTGGNKNTAPFTHRAPKVGKSAPPGD